MAGLTTLLLDDVGKLLDLALRSEECAELGSALTQLILMFSHPSSPRNTPVPHKDETSTHPLLGELLGLLVLRVPQQLHDSLLVRGESSDLSDDRLDEGLLLATPSAKSRQCPNCSTNVLTPFLWDGLTALGMTVVGWPRLRPDRESRISMGSAKSSIVSPYPPTLMLVPLPALLLVVLLILPSFRSCDEAQLTGSSSNHFDDCWNES